MQFRRSGQRDERRRRVLLDEALHTQADAENEQAANGSDRVAVNPRLYSEAAEAGRQPPVTCLIPKRTWTLCTLFLSGLIGIAAIETLYTHVFVPAPQPVQSALAGLNVTARGSLCGWYSALLLILALAASVLIFALRRHRLDDYRGRYRVWGWAALSLLLASLDAATGLHVVIAALLTEWSGLTLGGGERVWWIGALWVAFGLLALRIAWEIRHSRLAVVSASVAAAMYALATALELELWLSESSLLAAMASSGSQLLGHLTVALTAIAYCRFVYLDAQAALDPQSGRRRSRRPKQRQASTSKSSTQTSTSSSRRKGSSVRVDPAHEQSTQRTGTETANSDEAPAEPTPEDGDQKQLSKAERRRLRKQIRRQSRGA